MVGASGLDQMLLMPVGEDPALRVQYAPLMRYHRELWHHANTAVTTPTDVLTVPQLRKAYEIAQKLWNKGRVAQAGPIGAAIEAAARVKWKFKSAFQLEDEQGSPIDLWAGSPEQLKQTYVASHRKATFDMLQAKLHRQYGHLGHASERFAG